MAISISISNISTTSAILNIYGLNTEYPNKQLLIRLNGDFASGYFRSTSSSYSTNLNNLSPDAYYSIGVEVDYYDPATDSYIYQGQDSSQFYTQALTTTQYSVSVNNNEVTITINSFPNNSFANFYLYNSDKTQIIYSYNDSYYRNYHTFSDVANGNYYVAVDYQNVNTGISTIVYHQNDGQEFYLITVSGSGPSPTGNWSYDQISLPISNSYGPVNYNFNYTQCKLFILTFSQNGLVDLWSTNSNGDFEAWFSSVNNEYNTNDGYPIGYNTSDFNYSHMYGGGFDFSGLNVLANQTYYLWVKSVNQQQFGNFYLNITLTSTPVVVPTYTISQSNDSITVSINNAGTGFEFDPYIYYGPNRTGGIYTSGYSTSGSIVFTNIPNGTYYLWVLYQDNSISSDWIKNNLTNQYETSFTVGSQVSCMYIYNGSQWKKAIPYIYNGSQWKQAQAYVFNGSQWKKCGQ